MQSFLQMSSDLHCKQLLCSKETVWVCDGFCASRLMCSYKCSSLSFNRVMEQYTMTDNKKHESDLYIHVGNIIAGSIMGVCWHQVHWHDHQTTCYLNDSILKPVSSKGDLSRVLNGFKQRTRRRRAGTQVGMVADIKEPIEIYFEFSVDIGGQ